MNNPVNIYDPSGNFGISIPLIWEGVKVALGIIAGAVTANEVSKNTPSKANIGTTTIPNLPSTSKPEELQLKVVALVTALTLSKVKELPKLPPKQPNYWVAYRAYGEVVVDTNRPLTGAQAFVMVMTKQSIMCRNQGYASVIFEASKESGFNMLPEKHGDNYYYHYHTNSKQGNPHIWFY